MNKCSNENCNKNGVYYPKLYCRSFQLQEEGERVILENPVCQSCKKTFTLNLITKKGWQSVFELFEANSMRKPKPELTTLEWILITVYEEM